VTGAIAAVRTLLLVTPDLEWTEPRQDPEQGAVRAEIAAPKVLVQEREPRERDQDPHRERGHLGEELHHAYVHGLVIVSEVEHGHRPQWHDTDGQEKEPH